MLHLCLSALLAIYADYSIEGALEKIHSAYYQSCWYSTLRWLNSLSDCFYLTSSGLNLEFASRPSLKLIAHKDFDRSAAVSSPVYWGHCDG